MNTELISRKENISSLELAVGGALFAGSVLVAFYIFGPEVKDAINRGIDLVRENYGEAYQRISAVYKRF